MNREMPAIDRRMNAARICRNFLPPPQGLPFNETQEPEAERMQELKVQLDGATIAALRDLADKKGLATSAIVGMLVRDYLAEARFA